MYSRMETSDEYNSKRYPFHSDGFFPNVLIQYACICPFCLLLGHRSKKIFFNIFLSLKIFFIQQTVQTLMKCSIMQHFIWVFTVCQSTCLRVFRLKRPFKNIIPTWSLFDIFLLYFQDMNLMSQTIRKWYLSHMRKTIH